ncbi:unnamed protein product, partial [Rotaria magnacalcarata]
MYQTLEDYSSGLPFHEKALEILQKIKPSNNAELFAAYIHISGIYFKLGEDSTGMLFVERVIELQPESLPEDHPFQILRQHFASL